MSNSNQIYLLFPLLVYLSTLINIKIAYLILFLEILTPLFSLKFDIYYIYSLVISTYIIYISKLDFREIKDKLNELKRIKEEKNLILNDKKGQVEKIKIFEKKNEIIYSILNILRFSTDIESLKSIQRYIDEYVGCETSLVIFTDEAKYIYGKKVELLKTDEKIYKAPNYVLVNLSDKGKNIFSLILHNDVDVDEAVDLIDEISPSLKKIYLFEITQTMSQKDSLTGVFRRGIFTEKLEEEIIKARNFKHTLGLMLVDIDHFKNINDTYGHQVGDEVLKEVARVIKENVYETDFVARYGGEEFAIIMPRAQIEGSTRKAYYIKDAVSSHKIKAGLIEIKVTISIGIAYYPYDASSSKELFKNADKALYFSKKNGRNRVTLYQDIRE